MIRSLPIVLLAAGVLMISPAGAQDNAAPSPNGAPAETNAAPAPQDAAPAPQGAAPAPQEPVAAPKDRAASEKSGRFRFDKIEGGVLRLDSETGQVAVCGQRSVGWACQAAPEDRAALEKEIARIQEQYEALDRDYVQVREKNEAFEKQLAELREKHAALEKQLAELRNQNTALENKLTELRLPPAAEPAPPAAEPSPPRPPMTVPPSVRLPGTEPPSTGDATGSTGTTIDKDIERAKAFVRQAWRRLMDMIVNLQKDVMKKG